MGLLATFVTVSANDKELADCGPKALMMLHRHASSGAALALLTCLAAFVTGAFVWATIQRAPGDFARYFAFYWIWGLCAVALLFGMAEYKTSPLRKGRERGHLFILLYVGALLIITRALNMILYWG